MSSRSFTRINRFVIALLLFNLVVLSSLFFAIKHAEDITLRIMRSKEIFNVSNDLSKRLYEAGVALGGMSMTGSQIFSSRFNRLIEPIPHDVAILKETIDSSNKIQTDALLKVAELLPDTIKAMGEARESIERERGSGAKGNFREKYRSLFDSAEEIQKNLAVIANDCRDVAQVPVPKTLSNSDLTTLLIIAGALGNIFISSALFVSLRKTAKSVG